MSAESNSSISSLALAFLNAGGKRLRPRLCEAVYQSAAPAGTADLTQLLEAIECFHKASLVHDDIQDGDESRYGQTTLWRAHGIPVAIAVGDWLVAHGYALIADSDFPARSQMLAACARSHQVLSEGQGDELIGSGDYLSVCSRKTGEGFALAAELGALAAGVDPAPYRNWGLVYGTLFQIRDDRADGEGDLEALAAFERDYVQRLAGQPVGPFL